MKLIGKEYSLQDIRRKKKQRWKIQLNDKKKVLIYLTNMLEEKKIVSILFENIFLCVIESNEAKHDTTLMIYHGTVLLLFAPLFLQFNFRLSFSFLLFFFFF
jgi:hypothetical protein